MHKGVNYIKRDSVKVLLSVILAIGLFFTLSNSTHATPSFNEYPLPDAGSGSHFDAVRDLFLAPNNDPWFITSRVNGLGDRYIGTVDPCTENLTIKQSYWGHTGTNWTNEVKFLYDPGGNIWHTGFSQKVVKFNIDSNGNSSLGTEITLPGLTNVISGPMNLFIDAGGNFWYNSRVDPGNDMIYQASPTGTLLQSFNSGADLVSGLVFGSDGNLWYADMATNEMVRLTLSNGQTTKYSTAGMPRPEAKILGPDGNIWFTTIDNNTVGKITPDGVITLLATGLGWVENQMLIGSDGRLWYAAKNKIIAINTSDLQIEMFTIPNTDDIYNGTGGLKEEEDGSFWYYYRRAPKINTYLNNYTFAIGRFHSLGTPEDCTAPATTITSPTNATLSSNSISVVAASSDNVAVSKLELYINSVFHESVNNPASNHTFTWDTSLLSDGTYTLTTKAYDRAGNGPAVSTSVVVNLDKTKPTVAITAPTIGVEVSGAAVQLTASASDTNGVASVQFKLNGTLYGSEDSTAPYTLNWDTSGFANGVYTVSAVARDSVGNVKEAAPITITVNNVAVLADTTLCHFPGNQDQRTLTVAGSAVRGHLDHGDYTGRCLPLAVVATNTIPTTLDDIEELEEITVVRRSDNTTLATIDEQYDLSSVDLELKQDETLIVNGALGAVEVKKGATIKGNGRVKSLLVLEGAYLAPGSSPGCLTSDNLTLEGTYTFELGGEIACTEHDQVRVNGAVKLAGILEVELENGYTTEVGQSYTIIANDGFDAVENTFTGLGEGAKVLFDGVTYAVSYTGGDGNDVVLAVSEINETEMSAENSDNNQSGTEDNRNGMIYFAVGTIVIVLTIVLVTKKSSQGKK